MFSHCNKDILLIE